MVDCLYIYVKRSEKEVHCAWKWVSFPDQWPLQLQLHWVQNQRSGALKHNMVLQDQDCYKAQLSQNVCVQVILVLPIAAAWCGDYKHVGPDVHFDHWEWNGGGAERLKYIELDAIMQIFYGLCSRCRDANYFWLGADVFLNVFRNRSNVLWRVGWWGRTCRSYQWQCLPNKVICYRDLEDRFHEFEMKLWAFLLDVGEVLKGLLTYLFCFIYILWYSL